MKTRLVPQMNRDAMTSTWLGGSCDLRKTLIGGSTSLCQYLPCRSQALSQLLDTQAEKAHSQQLFGTTFESTVALQSC